MLEGDPTGEALTAYLADYSRVPHEAVDLGGSWDSPGQRSAAVHIGFLTPISGYRVVCFAAGEGDPAETFLPSDAGYAAPPSASSLPMNTVTSSIAFETLCCRYVTAVPHLLLLSLFTIYYALNN